MESQNENGGSVGQTSVNVLPRVVDAGQSVRTQASFSDPAFQLPPTANENQATQADVPIIKYAGFWIRYVAASVDGLVLMVPSLIVGFLSGFILTAIGGEKNIGLRVLFSLPGYFLGWTYYIVLTYKRQATLGKRAVGIKVFSDKSDQLTIGQLIIRESIGKLISGIILAIGYIMAGFTKRKQALHDKLAGTIVTYDDPNSKVAWWAVALALVLPIVAIIGIFSTVVLVSLNATRNKASDAYIKSYLSSAIAQSVLYQDEHGSYLGFDPKLNFSSNITVCSGQPMVNIAPDGKSIAIFSKLCSDSKKYFCADQSTSQEVDEQYAKSGASSCDKDFSSKSGALNIEPVKDNVSSQDGRLVSIYKDDEFGYEITYPDGWEYENLPDSESGMKFIMFSRTSDPSAAYVEVGASLSDNVLTQDSVTRFVSGLEKTTIDGGGKVFDDKDFIYMFDDGDNVKGHAFKAEMVLENVNLKQWTVVVPKGKNFYIWIYNAREDKFDQNYEDALKMLHSWKIKK